MINNSQDFGYVASPYLPPMQCVEILKTLYEHKPEMFSTVKDRKGFLNCLTSEQRTVVKATLKDIFKSNGHSFNVFRFFRSQQGNTNHALPSSSETSSHTLPSITK